LAPEIERGFRSACADLNPQMRFYVWPVDQRFPLDDGSEAISVAKLAKSLRSVK
jgi:uncharacterized protein